MTVVPVVTLIKTFDSQVISLKTTYYFYKPNSVLYNFSEIPCIVKI